MSRLEIFLHHPTEHLRKGRRDRRQGLQDSSADAAASPGLTGTNEGLTNPLFPDPRSGGNANSCTE
jgi:hypothetical protein